MPFSAIAAPAAVVEEVYYENNFDNGIDDLVALTNEYGSFVVNKERKIGTVELNGSTGIGVANPVNWLGKDNYFEFTNPIDSGILSISADIARTYDTTLLEDTVYNTSLFVNAPYPQSKYIFTLRKDRSLRGPLNSAEHQIETETNKIYRLNAIFDLDNDVLYSYIDGVLFEEQNLTAGFTISNAGVGISDTLGFVDNLRITKLSAFSKGTADEESDSFINEIVYYSNTFDNGKSSCVDYSDEYGTFDINNSLLTSEFNGNVGVGAKEAAWGEKSYYIFNEGKEVKTGILTMSFDVSKLDRESADQSCGIVFNEKHGNVKYALFIKKDVINGPKDFLRDWGDSSVTTPYELNKCYNVKLELDFDNCIINTYVDNVLLTERKLKSDFVLYDIQFSFSMIAAYVDNLIITHKYNYPLEIVVNSANAGNIFFDNEPVVADINILNRINNTVETNLMLEVLKKDSNEAVFSENLFFTIGAGEKKNLTVELPIEEFGVYELRATDGFGNTFYSEFSRSVISGGNNKKIGVCAHFDDTLHPSGDVSSLMALAENAGFGYIRTDWPRPVDENGILTDHFETNEKFSTYIRESIDKNIGMYTLLISLNGSYTDEDGGFATTDEALAAFESYCRQMAEKYKGVIEYFEIGNETHFKKNNDGTSTPVGDYVKLLKAAYTGIKAGNEDARVVAFSAAGMMPEVVEYIRDGLDIMKAEGKYYFDAISTHPYHGYYAPELKNWWDAKTWLDQPMILDEILADYSLTGMEKFASELGGCTSGDDKYNITFEQQAVYYVRKIMLNYAYDFYDSLLFYNLQDNTYPGDTNSDQRGILQNWNNVNWRNQTAYGAKSVYPAISFINSLLINSEFKTMTEENMLYRCFFEGDNKRFEVLWDVNETGRQVTFDENVSLYDIYGNLKEASASLCTATSAPVVAVYNQFVCNVSVDGERITALDEVGDSESLKMTVMSAYPGKTVALAKYENGNLKSINISEIDANGYSFFETDHSANVGYKLFLLDNLENIIPLSKSIELH